MQAPNVLSEVTEIGGSQLNLPVSAEESNDFTPSYLQSLYLCKS